MLFLQSVTKHADKLKQTGDSKVSITYTIYIFSMLIWMGVSIFAALSKPNRGIICSCFVETLSSTAANGYCEQGWGMPMKFNRHKHDMRNLVLLSTVIKDIGQDLCSVLEMIKLLLYRT
jgi:hypothetical protein